MDTNPKLEAGCFVVILQSEDLEEERRGDEVVEDCSQAKSDVGVKGFLRWIWLHLGWKKSWQEVDPVCWCCGVQ